MAEAMTTERIMITRSACPLVQWDAWDSCSSEFSEFAADRLGGPLPDEVGRITPYCTRMVIKAAPRRFWIFAPQPEDLPHGLPVALGTELDLSEGRMRLEVRTPRLRDVLAQCLAIDWDETLNRAAFAKMHRIPVMFSRNSADEGAFVVPRTFAQSIHEWLEDCL